MRSSISIVHFVLAGVVLAGGAIALWASPVEAPASLFPIAVQSGAQLVEARCTTCHDLAGTGIEAGLYPADEWRETVNRMMGYGLSLTEAEFESIVVYLGSSPGPQGSQPAPESSDSYAEVLLTRILDDLGGRQLALTRLVVAPGSSEMEHRHQAVLAVYVLSGEIESAVDGEAPTIHRPGDVWFESHMQLHSTFRNPSATEAAVLLIFAIRDADHPAVQADGEEH